MSKAAEVTARDFDTQVLQSDIPVLVDFWAEWCGPCRMVAPVLDQIAEEYEGRLKVLKLNVDSEAAVASKYGVMSIPTMMLFKDGEVVEQIVGAQPKQNIEQKVIPHLVA